MKIVFNSSPLIFLSKLDCLKQFIDSSDDFYVPGSVVEEIAASRQIFHTLHILDILHNTGNIHIQTAERKDLVNRLNQRFGKGESEAIALGIELEADCVLLDDRAARKSAQDLDLNVKGTLAIIKKLSMDGKINIQNWDEFYQKLIEIQFRVDRRLFNRIFIED